MEWILCSPELLFLNIFFTPLSPLWDNSRWNKSDSASDIPHSLSHMKNTKYKFTIQRAKLKIVDRKLGKDGQGFCTLQEMGKVRRNTKNDQVWYIRTNLQQCTYLLYVTSIQQKSVIACLHFFYFTKKSILYLIQFYNASFICNQIKLNNPDSGCPITICELRNHLFKKINILLIMPKNLRLIITKFCIQLFLREIQNL